MSAPAQSPILNFGLDFRAIGERLKGERADRLARTSKILDFGVGFIDAALGGIFPNDLILIGAASGHGKTEVVSSIALNAAKQKKRVHYFALEAEDREIERRCKYRMLASLIFNPKLGMAPHRLARMNYQDWYAGRLDDITGIVEDGMDERLAEQFGTLHTYYRGTDFTAETFERTVLALQDQTDLIILDHLHYVDTDDPNENRGYKIIVKKIRDVALGIGKPVIVVAHVRKAERLKAPIVPRLDDFHGTSDVPKIATRAVMLAPAFDRPSGSRHLWSTYLAPVKNRLDGSRTRYVGLVNFNQRSGSYDSAFTLGRLIENGTAFEPIPAGDIPEWAKQVTSKGELIQ